MRVAYRRFVWCFSVSAVAVLTWLVYDSRHTLSAYWCWYQWTRAADENDEKSCCERVFSEPHRSEKIAAAVACAGGRTPRQSYWIVTGRGATDNEALQCWARYFVASAARDPELVKLRLHALRWTPRHDRPRSGPASVPDYVAELDRTISSALDAELLWPDLQVVLPFLEALGLTGRYELARGVTESNWRERYIAWHDWYETRAAYLRWDEQQQRLVFDQDAFEMKQPVPVTSRRIPSVATPLPGWTGSNPE